MAEIWIGELAAPLMYLQYLLKELCYEGTYIYLAVEIVHIAVFTFSKMICGPYLIYTGLGVNYPLIIKAWAFALQLLYIFLFYKLVRQRLHKYFFKQRRSSSPKTE